MPQDRPETNDPSPRSETPRPPVRPPRPAPRPAVPREVPVTTHSPDESADDSAGGLLRRKRWQDVSSFTVSAVVHACLLTIGALIQCVGDTSTGGVEVIVSPTRGEDEKPAMLETLSAESLLRKSGDAPAFAETFQAARAPDAPNIAFPIAGPTIAEPLRPLDLAAPVPVEKLLNESSMLVGGGFDGRTQEQRARMVGQRGGTAASESAVELGLVWLAAHQRGDGGWRFTFDDGPCQGKCRNPGTVGTTTGATSLALLPFLGAGYTHLQGGHQKTVENGLNYLVGRMLDTPKGGDFQEGTMYAQGLAALTLCEAFAMTGDKRLQSPAQKAIDFICAAQHNGGGWRYYPGQPGDTTVTGWQIMALKSATLAGLQVSPGVVASSNRFLDSVQDGGGAFYGYQQPDRSPGPTAVGLLLRMYSGWAREDRRLERGATYLAGIGPSEHDVYFNYYATQVLHHHDGNPWPRWNTRMREFLIRTQAREGHEKGSWFFPDSHGTIGGRLYTTGMCIMILEVYYRYMPLYGDRAVNEAF